MQFLIRRVRQGKTVVGQREVRIGQRDGSRGDLEFADGSHEVGGKPEVVTKQADGCLMSEFGHGRHYATTL
jgi:hypothetical protein